MLKKEQISYPLCSLLIEFLDMWTFDPIDMSPGSQVREHGYL